MLIPVDNKELCHNPEILGPPELHIERPTFFPLEETLLAPI
jgi:hypothetical protein